MAWPSLVPPSPGTVITSAWESAMVNDPLLWLRLLTGNADPPGPNYVVVSTGFAATVWGKVTGDVLGPGAAVLNLGYAPVSRTGDVMSGSLKITQGTAGAAGYLILGNNPARYLAFDGSGFLLAGGSLLLPAGGITAAGNLQASQGPGSAAGYLILGSDASKFIGFDGGQFILRGGPVSIPVGGLTATGDLQTYRPGAAFTGYIILGASAANYIGYDGTNYTSGQGAIWTAGNMGPASGLSAQFAASATTLQGHTPSAAPGAGLIPIADGNGKLDGWVTGSGGSGGSSPHNHSGDSLVPATVTASGQLISSAATGTPPLVVASQTLVSNLNAALLGGYIPTATATAGRIPVADASGKLDAWVTSAGGGAAIPVGAIMAYNLGSLPAGGWIFHTALNDRLPVGAGSSFTLGASPNSVWTHKHTSNSFGGSASGGPEDSTGGPSTTNGLATAGGVTLPTADHSHSLNGVSFGVSVGGDTTDASWQPPMHVVNWIRKT